MQSDAMDAVQPTLGVETQAPFGVVATEGDPLVRGRETYLGYHLEAGTMQLVAPRGSSFDASCCSSVSRCALLAVVARTQSDYALSAVGTWPVIGVRDSAFFDIYLI